MARHCATRIVRRVARRAGMDKPIGPHTLRHASITAAPDAGGPLRDVQEAASHADRERPCATTALASHSTGTPPTSSPRTWLARHGRPTMPSGPARACPAIEIGLGAVDPARA
jgi:hypothetical protein